MALYDDFDYPSYWKEREYEHGSEVFAISSFLERIKSVKHAVEIGAGYGRLIDYYAFRAKRITLIDPSSALLKIAKENYREKNINFVKLKAENIGRKFNRNSFDLAIMVRVLHHIEDIDVVFENIQKILKKNGHFILEFPNKYHFKARVTELLKGNITYRLDISRKEVQGKKRKKVPFYNYHPDKIYDCLTQAGFEIIETRSVSNIRNPIIKKILSTHILLSLEKLLQKPFSYLSFGPSIFVLARRKN